MVRFYLLMEGGILDDGDFSFVTLDARVNGDLCNHYGNLLSRCTGASINPEQTYPRFEGMDQVPPLSSGHALLIENLRTLPSRVTSSFESGYFSSGIKDIFSVIRDCNVFFAENAPWKLVKEPASHAQLQQVLYTTYEVLRIASTLLMPIIPSSANRALDKLGVPTSLRRAVDASLHSGAGVLCGLPLQPGSISLFEKIQSTEQTQQPAATPKKNKKQKSKKVQEKE